MTDDRAFCREEIREVLARYNLAGDRWRLDELADCFCEDGVLEVRGEWEARGRAAIRSRLATVRDEQRESGLLRHDLTRESGLLRHHLTTHRAEPDGPLEARAWTYFLVITDRGLDHAGRYVDRLRRVDGRWLLAHRVVVVEWRSPSGRFALPSHGAGDASGGR